MDNRQICELYDRCLPIQRENEKIEKNDCNDCTDIIDTVRAYSWSATNFDFSFDIDQEIYKQRDSIDSLISRNFGTSSICKTLGYCRPNHSELESLALDNKTNTTARPVIYNKKGKRIKGPTRTPKPAKTPRNEVKVVDYESLYKNNKTFWGQCSAPIKQCSRGYNCSSYSGCAHLTICHAFGVGCVNVNCSKCKAVLNYMTGAGKDNFTISMMSTIWDDICTNTLRMEDMTCDMAKANDYQMIKNFFNFFATKMSSNTLCYTSKLCP
ncbi:hypothetical protein TVAG_093250 [Trichomonas vaginalis G3]|uniref:Uncharacterized protein n=1 Tax=Trichomonas vaginalis (strain ATCC PRA-98 / G3) TaxID=412133 RepID=A2DBE8_TRIV3|nr:saposin family [Trichomonas vaginalis G3]EAY22151.1 hypothetical protein TVAG_093250 [Trichomonas vaginalis G3]KAI5533401.1 saposin family [Trichomonas vaginalis G3]|eukprot:XP_001583137.1 hypothetical protein [Trichomonas vaginalis G3]